MLVYNDESEGETDVEDKQAVPAKFREHSKRGVVKQRVQAPYKTIGKTLKAFFFTFLRKKAKFVRSITLDPRWQSFYTASRSRDKPSKITAISDISCIIIKFTITRNPSSSMYTCTYMYMYPSVENIIKRKLIHSEND